MHLKEITQLKNEIEKILSDNKATEIKSIRFEKIKPQLPIS